MSDLLPEDNSDHFQQPSEKRVYSVSEITREIKFVIEGDFSALWIEGEISNFKRHTSGHLYFSLKDADAQIAGVMWRGRNQNLLFQPHDGMKVMAFGNLTVYERQGKYQLDVIRLQPAGLGDLQLAFEALKKKLQNEGLFSPELKKPIPPFPQRIAIVTSASGAAFHDIVSVISRRFPPAQLILRPVKVQGEGAAEEIAGAIHELNSFGNIDVMIVGRGGGSLEDLWAFNEEPVARAVYASKIPVISAVGHEIDFSICDFTADVRAPTPSAAAELAVPNISDVIFTIGHYKERMIKNMQNRIHNNHDRLMMLLRSYGFRWPEDRIRENRLRLDDQARSIERSLEHRLEGYRTNIEGFTKNLKSLNPSAVLERGYSITTRVLDQKVVRKASQINKKDEIHIQFAEGSANSVVESVNPG